MRQTVTYCTTGSRQSGELFRAKMQALEKLMKRVFGHQPHEIEFVYPTAPFPLERPDHPSELRERYGAWTWFQSESIDGTYPGLEGCLEYIASILKESGPFDGVIGFSQGAAVAAMVASLLEDNRKSEFARLEPEDGFLYPACFASLDHPPLRFVVSFSGYAASDRAYRAFYDPAIRTPSLHFLGSMDSVVDESVSMRLVESSNDAGGQVEPTVIWHSGGHVVPSGKRELAAVVQFVHSNVE